MSKCLPFQSSNWHFSNECELVISWSYNDKTSKINKTGTQFHYSFIESNKQSILCATDVYKFFIKQKPTTMPIENEFFKQMHNYFLYFNLFGMWSVWENSKHKFLFQSHLLSISIVVLLTFIYAIFLNRFFERNSLLGNLNNFLFIFIFGSHLTILFETFFSTKNQMEIIEKLSFFDRYFGMKFDIQIQYQLQKQKLFALNIMLMFPVILTNIMIVSYIYFWKAVFLNGLLSMYSTWITRSRFLQVIFFVYLLRERLKIINNELNRLRKLTHWPSADREIASLEIALSKQFIFGQLIDLKQAYKQLYDTCELINNTFGWSLLAVVVQCFVDITINCYATFLFFEQASYEDSIGLIILFGMAGAYLAILATLAFYSSSCSEYVRISVIFIFFKYHFIYTLFWVNFFGRFTLLKQTCVVFHLILIVGH